jgi:hypothetical protein
MATSALAANHTQDHDVDGRERNAAAKNQEERVDRAQDRSDFALTAATPVGFGRRKNNTAPARTLFA